jgi:predicted RNA-binding Zn-ribbon protein involved in translation (DUF1610 family)
LLKTKEIRKTVKLKQTQPYKVDLAKINGHGNFPCPRCGTIISPDDCTEEVYAILGTKVNKQGLEELVIRCKKCASELHLTGFSILQTLSEKNEEKTESEKTEEAQCYVTHV